MTKGWMVAGALLATVLAASSANAQSVRHYDCSKAGNATKTECKAAAAAAAKPAPVATPAKTRNYDCTKAGNANKAVCKGVAVAPAAKPANDNAVASKPATTRNYDCTKAGNANKTACKAVAPAPAAQPVAPAPRPTPVTAAAPAARSVSGQNTNPAGPNGATAKCRDGTFSSSAHRSGTCSRHGGVAQWF